MKKKDRKEIKECLKILKNGNYSLSPAGEEEIVVNRESYGWKVVKTSNWIKAEFIYKLLYSETSSQDVVKIQKLLDKLN